MSGNDFENGPARTQSSLPGAKVPPVTVDEERCAQVIVRKLIYDRRARERHFGSALFAEPAWDMLLDLYAAELAAQTVSTTSLAVAAGVPLTTALRWIGTLEHADLFERQPDPHDRRRVIIRLSLAGRSGMESYLRATCGEHRQ